MHTPFFPVWRARLAPIGQRIRNLRQQSLCHLELLLAPFLPPGLLSQADEGPNSRDRVFSVHRTFFGLLYQVLKPDTSCREIVRQVQALFALHERGQVDENTSAYCQARKRLPLDRLCRVRVGVAAAGEKMAALWHGLRPKLIDGTTVSGPDTQKNQRAYPQSRSQKPGCGFPLIRLVGVFSLAPRWLPQSWWKKIPAQLTVRVIRFNLSCPGYRPESVTLVTTLLDPQNYPAQDIAQLYARRWKIELWFRDIKTSLGMEVLRCKSPQMLHKELEMFFIAYNLIRCLMVQPAAINDRALDRMSFRGSVDSAGQFSLAIAQARSKQNQNQLILALLAVTPPAQPPDRARRTEP